MHSHLPSPRAAMSPPLVLPLPTQCRGDGCRSRTFTAVRETAACVDWQRLKVQEIVAGAPGSDGAEDTGGRVPRSLEVRG